MLSRVADNLYWMSRYLERAEHTARVVDVNLAQSLDQTPAAREQRWERVLASLGAAVNVHEPAAAVEELTFDQSNSNSIVYCIGQARENARQIREQISSEMFEQINRIYLLVRETNRNSFWGAQPHAFFKHVREGSHLFQGITDSTISRSEGWQFVQVGRYLERAKATAQLVDTQFRFDEGESAIVRPVDVQYLDLVGLLKSCTAFESYCRTYTADLQPARVAEFLLLSPVFPRSVCFAADVVQSSLSTIARTTGQRNAGRAERLAGRLRASLDYGQVDEIMDENLYSYIATIQHQCGQIHDAVHQTYIAYSADAALG